VIVRRLSAIALAATAIGLTPSAAAGADAPPATGVAAQAASPPAAQAAVRAPPTPPAAAPVAPQLPSVSAGAVVAQRAPAPAACAVPTVLPPAPAQVAPRLSVAGPAPPQAPVQAAPAAPPPTASVAAQAASPPADSVAAQVPLSPVASASPPEVGTPLTLRPSKPLELAREPVSTTGMGWKLGALALVLGVVAFYSRRKLSSKRIDDTQLTIVRRATVGFRSELIVVNVEGQRFLLGVTPQSIQSLALLDGDDATVPALAPAPSPDASSSLGDRFAAMLDAADRPDPVARSPRREVAAKVAKVASTEAAVSFDEEPDIGTQARGLLALRRPR
jgi:flagellar biogenesis protein FliO